MAYGRPGRHELLASHHVARYCRPRALRSDGRPLRDAFLLRPGEEYLSVNWLEYFDDADRQSQIAGVRRALADKGFQFRAAASFAVLNAGAAVLLCRDELNIAIRLVALGELRDPSHTGIYGYTASDIDVPGRLAQSVAAGEMYPAIS